jgi:cation diffusion facilitator CzcD-associated flavoprotein CzcO
VSLVTERIESIAPDGVRTADGAQRPADVLLLATGFKTHGFVTPMEIIGSRGVTLSEIWNGSPRAYLGLTVPEFPNLFLIYGPNTNGGTGSVIFTIEAGLQHVIGALQAMRHARAPRIEVRGDALERFDRELRAALQKTVWHTGCTNWYVDENGHDPNQWPWLWSAYRRRAAKIAPDAYDLGVPSRSPAEALG